MAARPVSLRVGAIVDSSVRAQDRQFYATELTFCLDIARKLVTYPGGIDVLLVDVDLSDAQKVLRLRQDLFPKIVSRHKIMMIERGDRAFATQARSLGATHVLDRPFDPDAFWTCLAEIGPVNRRSVAVPGADMPTVTAIADAAASLGSMFAALTRRGKMDIDEVNDASDQIITAVSETGIDRWLDTVRAHHVGTFQHCLLVTGTASAFALEIGLSHADTQMLTTAALLHDIGKAKIPLDILNKTGPLDDEEFAMMKRHPELGYDYLARQKNIPKDVLLCVRHHHEYLDGSGYPDRLKGSEIGDLTRILTVCDIYSALVEKRAYKRPKTSAEALEILEDLADDGKVERGLVRVLGMAMREAS